LYFLIDGQMVNLSWIPGMVLVKLKVQFHSKIFNERFYPKILIFFSFLFTLGPAKFTLQKFKEFPRVTGEWKMSEDWSAENGSKNPPRWVNFQKNEN